MVSQAVIVLSLATSFFLIFAFGGGIFASIKINDVQIKNNDQFSTIANITFCLNEGSWKCTAEHNDYSRCYLYRYNFTWKRICGKKIQLINSTDQLIYTYPEKPSCIDHNTIICYYSCASLDVFSLTKPEKESPLRWYVIFGFACISFIMLVIFGSMTYFIRQKEKEHLLKYETIL